MSGFPTYCVSVAGSFNAKSGIYAYRRCHGKATTESLLFPKIFLKFLQIDALKSLIDKLLMIDTQS